MAIIIFLLEVSHTDKAVLNAYWFKDYKSCEDLEREFKRFETGLEFDDEPLKDCFCKI